RLAETRAEATLHQDALVRSLAKELDATMGQLISLTASMQSKHENTAVVALALAQDLRAEYTALQAARMTGQRALVQALDATTVVQQQAISQNNLMLPALDDGQSFDSSAIDPHQPTRAHGSPPTVPPGQASRFATPPNVHGPPALGGGKARGGKSSGG